MKHNFGNPHPELHPENLEKGRKFQAGEQAREAGRKGGRKTQENNRKRKTLQECAEILLSQQKKVGGVDLSGAEAMMLGIFNKALHGDVQAAKFIRETIGEDPAQKVELMGKDGGAIQTESKVILDDVIEALKTRE